MESSRLSLCNGDVATIICIIRYLSFKNIIVRWM